MLNKKLNDIFKYYKKKYKLKTILIFENSLECGFLADKNYITYDFNYITNEVTNDNIEQYDKKYKHLFCLLHEIGHSVDWKCNNKQFKRNAKQIDWFSYHTDYNYVISLPIEKRANKFAREELEKWIKC